MTVNTTSYCRKEVVEVDASLLPTGTPNVCACFLSPAPCADLTHVRTHARAAAQVVGAKALVAVTLPPYGFAAASRTRLPIPHLRLRASANAAAA